MKEFESIKEFYQPIQPTVAMDDKEIVYREIKPGKIVENFVYCLWQLKTPKPLKTPFVYRVVSDGCIDIFFDHNHPTEKFIMGFCRKYTEFPIGKDFDYIGIRFLPSAFPLLFEINAKDLSNRSQALKPVLPDYAEWIDTTINSNQSFERIAKMLSNKLREQIQNGHLKFDSRFLNSMNVIFQHKGYLDTERDLPGELSPRQLRRIFNFYIGTTPKAFSNVVRFQQVLNAKPSIQGFKEDKFYFDVGFFDQAHFIKNFKNFYGVTPSKAFR